MQPLILASTSSYRADLLIRLKLPFTAVAPNCDETPLPGETPSSLVKRLSAEKARSVQSTYPDALIIGSDQVCDVAGVILGKPATEGNAVQQLQAVSGKTVVFRTGLCLLDGASDSSIIDEINIEVHFRTLSDNAINRYVSLDQPLDCAGSFRSEGLGVSLVSSIDGSDPTALVGLPLIRLCEMLRAAHVPI